MQSTSEYKENARLPVRIAARLALGSALLLGLAAERLLWHGITGAGWVLWIALFGTSAVVMVHQAHFPWLRETALAAAIAVGAAVIAAVRASEMLHVLSLLVLVTAASVPLLRARSLRFGATPVLPQLLGPAVVAAHAALGLLLSLRGNTGRGALPVRLVRQPVLIAARGALLAVPPLAIFGALFISADPLFERYVRTAVNVVTEDVLGRVLIVLAFGWIAAGLLNGLLPRRSVLSALPAPPALPVAEIAVALGAVAALFMGFVLVQARWLFDGAAAVQATTGLTVADYARRGFFELTAAAALTLPLLLAAHAVTRPATPAARRLLRVLSISLVLLVLVMMGSALERMALYTERFGLTELRLYTTAFMGWLSVVFGWFLITTLRGRRRRFAAGPVAAGVVATLTLAVLNPDALIARVNLERSREGAALDAAYLTQLSADAVPELLRNFDAVPASSRCDLARSLLRHDTEVPDWRAANRSSARARALVQNNSDGLTSIVEKECPPDR